ncbi:MAG: hypothetical protein JWM85_3622 [Acidimicrobiaceae bacterium]|nr:hypothetical protein [Acidimicrobiaceae bacterium]MDF2435445.1 hypothetical protein [Mucilaginibacter sp.]
MSPANSVLILLTALAVKHFICDFCLQPAFMYANKGNWRHSGGYIHALFHAWTTIIVLGAVFGINQLNSLLLTIGAAEFVAHFVIDYSKVNIGKKYDLKPNNSEWFWVLLGLDQLLHGLTYIAIAYYLVT